MSQKMGLLYGLESNGKFCKRQNRWLFTIPGVCADDTTGVSALPPQKSARPNIGFKEMEARHLIEDVYYPAKPDWKPISITLYDLKLSSNPVWDWIKKVYDAKAGNWFPSVMSAAGSQGKDNFIKECQVKMFDGCGELVETWIYEDAWIQSSNFQTLDMTQGSVLTIDITLRYARAYIN